MFCENEVESDVATWKLFTRRGVNLIGNLNISGRQSSLRLDHVRLPSRERCHLKNIIFFMPRCRHLFSLHLPFPLITTTTLQPQPIVVPKPSEIASPLRMSLCCTKIGSHRQQ
mmetsp:Transcript_24680/g.37736  ORF Transcript_24680/g.37736 Transcript_24680/m.37736 type:complete len:113 (+) Transcript_24680:732-1070(+)